MKEIIEKLVSQNTLNFGKCKTLEDYAELENKFVKKLLEAINHTRCCTELKDKPKLNFGDWKFSQGLRYMSDFTYKNAKGELFDADVVNNTYNDYYNL